MRSEVYIRYVLCLGREVCRSCVAYNAPIACKMRRDTIMQIQMRGNQETIKATLLQLIVQTNYSQSPPFHRRRLTWTPYVRTRFRSSPSPSSKVVGVSKCSRDKFPTTANCMNLLISASVVHGQHRVTLDPVAGTRSAKGN